MKNLKVLSSIVYGESMRWIKVPYKYLVERDSSRIRILDALIVSSDTCQGRERDVLTYI